MLIHNHEQNSPEWYAARLGIPTASDFDKIITPQGKEGGQAEEYVNYLLAELLAGAPVESYEGNRWMKRGNELEPDAVDYYEFETNNETQRVGFITDDAHTMGASPDRMVGGEGLVEIKCLAPGTQVKHLLIGTPPIVYKPQLQGQLLITGRKWVDLVLYHPTLPKEIYRIERDERYIAELERLILRFLRELGARKRLLIERGYKCNLTR